MSIRYYLSPNSQSATEDTYHPVVQTRNDLKTSDLVTAVAAATGQTETEVATTLGAVGAALATILAAGDDLDWADMGFFKPNISEASVTGAQGALPATARGTSAFSARGAFKDVLANASFERTAAPSNAPEWKQVSAPFGDMAAVTPGTIIEVVGANLGFNTAREDEGVYLEPIEGGGATKAPAVLVHTAQKLSFQIPAGLTSGADYRVELRTRGARAADSAALQTFLWSGTVTAA